MAATRLAGTAHGALSERGGIDIAIVGATGRVGRRVLELIDARRTLLQRSGVRLRIVAAANSRRLLVAPDGLAAGRIAELLPDAVASTDPLALTRSPLQP